MGTKTWNFLLPDTGAHELIADNLGRKNQTVRIDGVFLEAPEGCLQFTGPGGSLLELRNARLQKDGAWELLVNGLAVEEYSPSKRKSGDDSLRDLKGRPDGSYTIATTFKAAGLDLNVVRKYRFTAKGVLHEVAVAHQDWVWQVIHNGEILERLAHSMWESKGSCAFEIQIDESTKANAEVKMFWDTFLMIWTYNFSVNNISIHHCYTKTHKDVVNFVPPEVIGAPDEPPQAAATSKDVEAEAKENSRTAMELPQGVSYDASCGSYQANIRMHNRFVFLGEYATPEEAHQRYLEEAEKIKKKSAAEKAG